MLCDNLLQHHALFECQPELNTLLSSFKASNDMSSFAGLLSRRAEPVLPYDTLQSHSLNLLQPPIAT